MSTNLSSAIIDEPIINNKTEQAVKRPPSEELNDDSEVKKAKTEGFERIKRKNCAMLMGYLGVNYYGMQRNKGWRTIEEELFDALLKADLITDEAFNTMQSICFQRAARTDKFVSAAGQIVNMKLPDNSSKEVINKYLPDDIRVFAIKRVTRGFNSKNMCDARTYSYTLPTYALATDELKYDFSTKIDFDQVLKDLSVIDGKPFHEYRITEEKLDQLSRILKKFEGPHNFHNFTSKLKPLDPRTNRYVISLTCGRPFVASGVEFVTIEIKGQSFILHQIRKMIGTVMGVLRGNTTEEIFDRCFSLDKIDLPRAPGLGLVLKKVHMDYYNKRYGKDGIHDSLEWTDCEEELNTFFEEKILKHIIDTEIKENEMLKWLSKMPFHDFDVRNEEEDEKTNKEDKEDKCNNDSS